MYTPPQSENSIEGPARLCPVFWIERSSGGNDEIYIYVFRSPRLLAGGRNSISSRQRPTGEESDAPRQMA
jgi:hypothetical protein